MLHAHKIVLYCEFGCNWSDIVLFPLFNDPVVDALTVCLACRERKGAGRKRLPEFPLEACEEDIQPSPVID